LGLCPKPLKIWFFSFRMRKSCLYKVVSDVDHSIGVSAIANKSSWNAYY
jgi:hypothetical protein